MPYKELTIGGDRQEIMSWANHAFSIEEKAMKQLGTLGGGNHFIEVCLDTENFVWSMLHSGSRNIGKELAERHISTAKSLWRLSELPALDLAYFIQGTPEFAAYWKD